MMLMNAPTLKSHIYIVHNLTFLKIIIIKRGKTKKMFPLVGLYILFPQLSYKGVNSHIA